MPAKDALNKDLFHGTHRVFKPGDVILPASAAGVHQNWGEESSNNAEVAHATDDITNARFYAGVSRFNNRKDPSARARVYQVEPVNPEEARWQEKPMSNDTTVREHVSSEGYRVVKRVWVEPKQK